MIISNDIYGYAKSYGHEQWPNISKSMAIDKMKKANKHYILIKQPYKIYRVTKAQKALYEALKAVATEGRVKVSVIQMVIDNDKTLNKLITIGLLSLSLDKEYYDIL